MSRLEQLPAGITGFDFPAGHEKTSLVQFKAACFEVARELGATVSEVTVAEDRSTISYHSAVLKIRGSSHFIVCNACYPLMTEVAQDSLGLPKPNFIYSENIYSAFETLTNFTPLDPAFLNEPITKEIIVQLGQSELKQLTHWQKVGMADRIGDIIFNTWD